jgi:hypothetical protein
VLTVMKITFLASNPPGERLLLSDQPTTPFAGGATMLFLIAMPQVWTWWWNWQRVANANAENPQALAEKKA